MPSARNRRSGSRARLRRSRSVAMPTLRRTRRAMSASTVDWNSRNSTSDRPEPSRYATRQTESPRRLTPSCTHSPATSARVVKSSCAATSGKKPLSRCSTTTESEKNCFHAASWLFRSGRWATSVLRTSCDKRDTLAAGLRRRKWTSPRRGVGHRRSVAWEIRQVPEPALVVVSVAWPRPVRIRSKHSSILRGTAKGSKENPSTSTMFMHSRPGAPGSGNRSRDNRAWICRWYGG